MRRHTQPFVPCPKCGKQIKERALDKHLKYTHKEKQDIACTFPDCDQMFKQLQTLQNHIRKVHEKEKSLCINCGETVSHLCQHKLTCCPDKRTVQEQTCSVCHKSYSSKAQREQHEKIVHESAKACPTCGKTVKWLESRMKNKHTERDKLHMCTEDNCGKSFKTSSEVKMHHISVHQKLRRQCSEWVWQVVQCTSPGNPREKSAQHNLIKFGVHCWILQLIQPKLHKTSVHQ